MATKLLLLSTNIIIIIIIYLVRDEIVDERRFKTKVQIE